MPIEVVANIASRDDALQAVRHGADGVGLLRTEFLFLDRPQPPGEDEQLEAYLSIADALGGRRLTVRTLDVGGDKPVPYLPAAAEANPFLGRRGLRLSLQQPDCSKQQLRALVRAGMQHPITVLFPMVTTIDELRAARALLAEAAAEVGCAAGDLPPGFEVGAMAEVPAFALHARAAVPLVDLISIGTNDLTQYTLAAERGNADVALRSPIRSTPPCLHLISEVARRRNREGPSRRVRRDGRRPRRRRPAHRPRRPRAQHEPHARIPAVKDAIRSTVGQQGETTRRPRPPPRLGRQRARPPR